MANVFGGGGSSSGGPIRSPSTSPSSQSSQMSSNVFGGGGGSCFDGGRSRVIPTSTEALQPSQVQSFSTGPNVYSENCSVTGAMGLEDFYSKSEIQKLLRTKADISSVYTKSEVDSALTELENEVNQSLLGFITEPEVDAKISEFYDSLLSYLSQNYYNKTQTYSKSQVDSLIASVSLGDGFVLKQPTTTAQNTISPGTNEAVPLTLIASTDPDITTIQHWIGGASNSVGRIKTSGRVEFYGHMVLGQNIETWRPALDASERRISGVSDPIHMLDAVNKKYMEDYIVEVVDNIQQGDEDLYDIDGLVY